MDQKSLFEDVSINDFDAVKDILSAVVADNWLDPDALSFNERKGYYAASFNDAVFARIPKLKKLKRVEILSPCSSTDESFKGYEVSSWADLANYSAEFVSALQAVIDRVPKGFSCCSRYVECSDLRACCHPDYDMRAQCFYRKVLKSGRVFYGKNAEDQI